MSTALKLTEMWTAGIPASEIAAALQIGEDRLWRLVSELGLPGRYATAHERAWAVEAWALIETAPTKHCRAWRKAHVLRPAESYG